MSMRRPEDLLNLAIAACEAAGRVINASPVVTAEVKGPGNWVSATDRGAEDAALAILRAGTPDIPVLAEESGGFGADRLWVVDPLDGTTNFLRGFPMVGVSIALLDNGEPRIGVVSAPKLGERWQAVRGGGAHDLRGRRLDIASGPGRGVTATGFPFRLPERRDAYLRVMNRALGEFEDLRRPGAASLDLAYVAAGTWSGFFEVGLAVWDIAAGVLLVREAGGVATDWAGNASALFDSGDILAGNPAWHELMLGLAASP